jgi:hypothetical protein
MKTAMAESPNDWTAFHSGSPGLRRRLARSEEVAAKRFTEGLPRLHFDAGRLLQFLVEPGMAPQPSEGGVATGQPVSAGLMIFYRLADGRIAEHWMQFDNAGLMARLSEAAALKAA